MSKKLKAILAVLCAVVLVFASVAGTMAFLTASSGAVTNTFMAGDDLVEEPENPEDPSNPDPTENGLHLLENIATLSETTGNYELGEGYCYENSYTVVPGMLIPKNPAVSIVGKTETPAYLFFEVVDGLDNTDEILTYSINTENWLLLEGVTGANGGAVYAYTTDNSTAAIVTADVSATSILTDDQIAVSADATLEQIKAAMEGDGLVFYAYLAQAGGFESAAEAYTTCFPASSPEPA